MIERREPLWRATIGAVALNDVPPTPLCQAMKADVVVVGAGITGLSTAFHLAKSGLKVIVLEAGRIGSGTTGASTAHVTVDCDHDYAVIERAYGLDTARLLAAAMADGGRLIASTVEELGIACDFGRLSGYRYTEDESGVAEIESSFDAARRVGLDVALTRHIPLPFRTVVGYELQDQAQLDPLAYLAGLAKAARKYGVVLCEESRVIDFETGERCRVMTANGEVEASTLVLATHTPIGRSPLHAVLVPMRSYVMALKLKGKAPLGLFRDTAQPYHYVRRQASEHGSYVLVGGADRKTAHGSDEESFSALARYISERFEIEEVGYLWASQFYDSLDHLPYIGAAPLHRNTLLATGFSGDGITFGALAGEMLASQARGLRTPYDDLFRPARVRIEGIKGLLHEAFDLCKSFVGDRLSGESRATVERLNGGDGAVVGSGQNKFAVYRDEGGELHGFSAVCPHMHCIVRWNAAERSFDCPCHGSRFSCAGAPIEGPALTSLTPLPTKDWLPQKLNSAASSSSWLDKMRRST